MYELCSQAMPYRRVRTRVTLRTYGPAGTDRADRPADPGRPRSQGPLPERAREGPAGVGVGRLHLTLGDRLQPALSGAPGNARRGPGGAGRVLLRQRRLAA